MDAKDVDIMLKQAGIESTEYTVEDFEKMSNQELRMILAAVDLSKEEERFFRKEWSKRNLDQK